MSSSPAALILPSGIGGIKAYENKIPHKIHAINLCFLKIPLNVPLVHITVLSVLPVMTTIKESDTLVHPGSFTSETK